MFVSMKKTAELHVKVGGMPLSHVKLDQLTTFFFHQPSFGIRRIALISLTRRSDGAREHKVGEKQAVEEVRNYILKNVDWECELHTKFNDSNLGCGLGVSTAVSWFFDNEENGIILEDDCLPHASFFSYCETLLDYYKDNERVLHIGGNHFLDFEYGNASYYFATIEHCWGWASWARAWKYFNLSLDKYPQVLIEERLFNFYNDNNMRRYWLDIYTKMRNKEIDTWAYPWSLSIIANDGLAINPNKNLVSNIGFDGSGTHTFGKDNPNANLPTEDIGTIIHPKEIKRSLFIDEKIMNRNFCVQSLRDYKIEIMNLENKVSSLESRNNYLENKINKVVDSIAWFIPVRKWRDSFKNKIK